MKGTLAFVLLVLFSKVLSAQVTISGGPATPDPSAMLDVQSTTKGILLPRMTYSQRTAIAAPATGLMVYQTNTSTTPRGFYIYDGTGWKEMAKADDVVASNSWTVSGSNQYSSVSGFVGIGTSSPTEKLHISNGQLRLSRTSLFENSIVFNMPPTSGAAAENEGLKFRISDVDIGFAGFTSSSFGGDYFRISADGIGGSHLVITQAGYTGLGTSQPTERLHVAGNALLNATNPTLQLQNEGIDKGFVQLSGDNLRLGTNSSNDAGKLVMRLNGTDHVFVESDGKTGIGQDNPQAKLHINSGASSETLRLTGNTNTLIRMMTGGTDKANIYSASNHLSLTTVQAGGQVRLGNEVYIQEDINRVGIGTSLPSERLDVSGNIKTSTGKVLNSSGENMLPVAYGRFNIDGSKHSGTANISASAVTSNGVEYFVVTVAGVDLSNAVASVTSVTNYIGGRVTSATPLTSDTSKLRVSIDIPGGDSVHSPFHIVIYKAY